MPRPPAAGPGCRPTRSGGSFCPGPALVSRPPSEGHRRQNRVASPNTLWLVGRPRRRSSSSMQGRSSWIRSRCEPSQSPGKGQGISTAPPHRRQASSTSTGRRRFPPTKAVAHGVIQVPRAHSPGNRHAASPRSGPGAPPDVPARHDYPSLRLLLRFHPAGQELEPSARLVQLCGAFHQSGPFFKEGQRILQKRHLFNCFTISSSRAMACSRLLLAIYFVFPIGRSITLKPCHPPCAGATSRPAWPPSRAEYRPSDRWEWHASAQYLEGLRASSAAANRASARSAMARSVRGPAGPLVVQHPPMLI